MITLHQERFEAWLFNQPAERIINALEGPCCFLASFLKETTRHHNACCVGWMDWVVNDKRVCTPRLLPEWARKLINPADIARLGDAIGRTSCGAMQQHYRELFLSCEPVTVVEVVDHRPSTRKVKHESSDTTGCIGSTSDQPGALRSLVVQSTT